MFKNFFKLTIRNMIKQREYSLVNLFGFTLGMTTCILILLYVRYELSWNSTNSNYKNIYGINQKVLFKDNEQIYTQTGYPLAAELKNNFPEFKETTVLGHVWGEYLSSSDDIVIYEKRGFYASPSLFRIFDYHFIQGNSQDALAEPYSVVLTQEMAEKYFPGENAFGRTIRASYNQNLKITGIIKNLPFNLDYRPDYLVSFQTWDALTDWQSYKNPENIAASAFQTFVLLHDNIAPEQVNAKIYNFADNYVDNNYKKFYLQPLSELHTSADGTNDVHIALYYMAGISLFVLLLACINFVNLTTANSFLRKKEIGIRKVSGSNQFVLFGQFVGEFLVYAFLSMILAFIFAKLLLFPFNSTVQRPLEIQLFKDAPMYISLLGLFTLTAILSAIYPALFMSSFQPIDILKGNLTVGKHKITQSKVFMRKFLVTFQFIISVTIIISTLYVSKQVHYMKNKDLGFEKDNLVVCKIAGAPSTEKFSSLQNELCSNANIVRLTHSANIPFRGSWGQEINWQGSNTDDRLNTRYNIVDYDFIETLKIKLKQGRNFSQDFPTDKNACLVNEELVRQIGWQDPIGKKINENQYTIIGVVEDFHPYSVHSKIPPYYMTLGNDELATSMLYSVRVQNNAPPETVQFISNTLKAYFPDAIVDVQYFTKSLRYGTEDVWEVLAKIFFAFAIIAVLIAANGLYGLISYAVHRRIKEVGIRKVLGSGIPHLYYLISKEFLTLLTIAGLVSCPLGYLVAKGTPGAYKYTLQAGDYLLCILLMLLTAIIATTYHTTKAVLTKPVDTLRYE